MRPSRIDRSRSYFRLNLWLVLACLIMLAYGGSLANGFVFDDSIFMEHEARLRALEGIRRLFLEPLWAGVNDSGTQSLHQYYRPLQLLPLALTRVYFDGAAWPCHLLSLVLHLLNSVLVYAILHRLSGSRHAAFAIAALFAVHPASSETVLWISAISGLGAGFCVLSVVLLHMRHRPTAAGSLLAGLLYLAAMFFKESGILLPLLLILYDAVMRPPADSSRDSRVAMGDYAAMLAPLAIYLVLRDHALGGFLPGATSLELGPAELAINAVALIPMYVAKFAWIFEPNMYHDFVAAEGTRDPRFVYGAVTIALATISGLVTWRSRPIVRFGFVWAAITVAPYLLVRWPQLNVFAERYLYLPSVGVYAAMVGLTGAATRDRRGRYYAVAVATLIALFVWIDTTRTKDWADEETIYSKTLEQSQRAELIRNNLALRYLDEGRAAEGIPLQEELVKLSPDFPRAWHNLGLLYLATRDAQAALHAFQEAARREPNNPSALLNLGYAHDLNGEREEAIKSYFRLLGVRPESVEARYNLAVIAFELGQLANAKSMLHELLDHDTDDKAAKSLLSRIELLGRPQDLPRAPPSLTLERCSHARRAAEAGRFAEAIATAKMASWFDEISALPHHYLANIYYMSGAIEPALIHQRLALERAPTNPLYRYNLASLEKMLKRADAPAPRF